MELEKNEEPLKTEDNVVLFKCIVDFIHCLKEMYGKQHHNLQLYDLLMEKTGIVHQEPIKKHIQLFREFVNKNRDGILENDESKINQWKIEYSDKVFIDLKIIFSLCADDDKTVLWEHLLTLMAVLEPESNAKLVLKERKVPSGNGDFLSNMIHKVESSIDPNMASDPAQMMSGILSSGLFTELMNDMNKGMQNGDLDLNNMMGSLQNMIGSMSTMFEGMNQNK